MESNVLITAFTKFYENIDDSSLQKSVIEKFSFLLNQVVAYNSCNEKETTILLKSGLRFAILIDYCTFDEIFKSQIDKEKCIYIASPETEYNYLEQKN